MKHQRPNREPVHGGEIQAVRPPKGSVRAWCEKCGDSVFMVNAEEAAALIGAPANSVDLEIEQRKLHFRDTRLGFVLVCTNSLSESKHSALRP
ncbi:MAG: hypothetical protein WCA98_04925 [Candidatus Acidiferrales bacterium]